MKYLGKILWGIISTAICIAYKTDANADCTFKVTNREKLSTNATLNFATCSAGTICQALGGALTSCSGQWIRIEDLAKLQNNHSSIRVNTLCSRNYYIASCKNSAGTIINLPTANNIADCKTGILCSSCPSSGNTQSESVIIKYGDEYYDSNYMYVCASVDAVSGSNLNGLYMQEVKLTCDGYTEIKQNPITNCYQKSQSQYRDVMGSYTLISSCFYER